MKAENRIRRLCKDHTTDQIVAALADVVGLDKVLLAVSNRLMANVSSLKDRAENNTWRKRARTVHKVMEELQAGLVQR